jgi:hypothetical protein
MKTWLYLICACLLVGPCCLAVDGFLPQCAVVSGWQQKGEAREYGAETLYDYMDGNSEGYLIYGFHQMHGVSCEKDGVTLIIDVSQMPDAESAFGLFASNRDPRLPLAGYAMAAQVAPQRAIYAKGNLFVEIAANPSDRDHTETLQTWASALEKLTPGSTAPPDELTWFPKEGLDEASIRLIPQSVLGLSALRKGYLARYEFGRAFLTRQADAAAAQAVLSKLQARFSGAQPAQVGDEAFSHNDKYLGRLVFFRKGPYVAGWVNLAEGKDPVETAQALAAKIR